MKNTFILFSAIILLTSSALANEDDYPRSPLEREMDEMGSALGGEGLVFKPGKEKSTATRATVDKMSNINKYLYTAAIDVLKFAPLASADSKGGTVITEWYSPKGQKNTQFKVNVYIRDNLITPEALDVVAFQRKKVKGQWLDQHESSPIATTLEDKILRKARELYLKSGK